MNHDETIMNVLDEETNGVTGKFRFVCPNPNCDCNRVEEILTEAVVSTPILEINAAKDDHCADLDYGNQSVDDGQVNRYQCVSCGHVLKGIADNTELWNWFLEHGEKVS
jgi:hypothetical protein